MTLVTNEPSRRRRGLHPEQIKALVRMRGLTLVGLGRRHGYSPSAMKQALRRPCGPCERIIAKAIGLEPEKIWPERYKTKRLRRRGGPKSKPMRRGGPRS